MPLFNAEELDELNALTEGMLEQVVALLRGARPAPRTYARMLRRLHEKFGMPGAAFAIRAWLDQAIEHADIGEHREVLKAVAFGRPDGSGFDDPRAMDPEYQWAALALLARIADDQITLYQMIDSLPPDQRMYLFLLRIVELVAGVIVSQQQPDRGQVRAGDVLLVSAIADQ